MYNRMCTRLINDIVKTANAKLAEEGSNAKELTPDYSDQSLFERLSNSAPISSLIDASDKAGWTDIAQNAQDALSTTMGDIGTALGNYTSLDLSPYQEAEDFMSQRLNNKNQQLANRFDALNEVLPEYFNPIADNISSMGRGVMNTGKNIMDGMAEARKRREFEALFDSL